MKLILVTLSLFAVLALPSIVSAEGTNDVSGKSWEPHLALTADLGIPLVSVNADGTLNPWFFLVAPIGLGLEWRFSETMFTGLVLSPSLDQTTDDVPAPWLYPNLLFGFGDPNAGFAFSLSYGYHFVRPQTHFFRPTLHYQDFRLFITCAYTDAYTVNGLGIYHVPAHIDLFAGIGYSLRLSPFKMKSDNTPTSAVTNRPPLTLFLCGGMGIRPVDYSGTLYFEKVPAISAGIEWQFHPDWFAGLVMNLIFPSLEIGFGDPMKGLAVAIAYGGVPSVAQTFSCSVLTGDFRLTFLGLISASDQSGGLLFTPCLEAGWSFRL